MEFKWKFKHRLFFYKSLQCEFAVGQTDEPRVFMILLYVFWNCITNVGFTCPPELHFFYDGCEPIAGLWITQFFQYKFTGIQKRSDFHDCVPVGIYWRKARGDFIPIQSWLNSNGQASVFSASAYWFISYWSSLGQSIGKSTNPGVQQLDRVS